MSIGAYFWPMGRAWCERGDGDGGHPNWMAKGGGGGAKMKARKCSEMVRALYDDAR